MKVCPNCHGNNLEGWDNYSVAMRLALCLVSVAAFGWMAAPVLADPQAPPVDVDAIHKQFAAKDAAIADLKQQLADRDKQLSELRNAPNAKRARSDAAAKDAMIADLRSQLAAWQVWAGKVNAQIKDLQDTIDTLRVDTKAKDARIGVLEEDLTQRKQDLKDALSALAGSHQAAEGPRGTTAPAATTKHVPFLGTWIGKEKFLYDPWNVTVIFNADGTGVETEKDSRRAFNWTLEKDLIVCKVGGENVWYWEWFTLQDGKALHMVKHYIGPPPFEVGTYDLMLTDPH